MQRKWLWVVDGAVYHREWLPGRPPFIATAWSPLRSGGGEFPDFLPYPDAVCVSV